MRGVGFEPTKYRAHRKENPRQLEKPSFNQALSDLVTFALWMQRSGYRPSTVRERATLRRQFERRQQLEAYRKSPRYKLDKLTEKQQVLLDKIARCQRRLKKVQRGIKIWEKKAKQVDSRIETGQNGIQTPEGKPGLMRTR
jgi:hypothetical protein